MNDQVLKALAVTAELTGTELSKSAARVMASDLDPYPPDQVIEALKIVRYEARRGGLTVEAVVSRLPDGRPGPEEAWAMVPASERDTVVWTDECTAAWAACRQLLEQGEKVAARMTFKERYTQLVRNNRHAGRQVVWTVSLGHDLDLRRMAVLDAVDRGRLTPAQATAMLPNVDVSTGRVIEGQALLAAPQMPEGVRNQLLEFVRKQKARSAEMRRQRNEEAVDRDQHTFHNEEWCRQHGVRFG